MKRHAQIRKQGQPRITNMREYYHAKWGLLPGETLAKNKRNERVRVYSDSAKRFEEVPDIKRNLAEANKNVQYIDTPDWSVYFIMQRIMFRIRRMFAFLRSYFKKGN